MACTLNSTNRCTFAQLYITYVFIYNGICTIRLLILSIGVFLISKIKISLLRYYTKSTQCLNRSSNLDWHVIFMMQHSFLFFVDTHSSLLNHNWYLIKTIYYQSILVQNCLIFKSSTCFNQSQPIQYTLISLVTSSHPFVKFTQT